MPTIRREPYPHIICPIPPYCSYSGDRHDAEVWLVAPDGEPNPGGYFCRQHGELVLAEFETKLDEVWTLVPILREAPIEQG